MNTKFSSEPAHWLGSIGLALPCQACLLALDVYGRKQKECQLVEAAHDPGVIVQRETTCLALSCKLIHLPALPCLSLPASQGNAGSSRKCSTQHSKQQSHGALQMLVSVLPACLPAPHTLKTLRSAAVAAERAGIEVQPAALTTVVCRNSKDMSASSSVRDLWVQLV